MYVIDGVWEYMNTMKDWPCIISLLGEDNSDRLDRDVTNLATLLSASVRKAVGDRIIPASDYRQKRFAKAQQKTIKTNREDITRSMMTNYPLLLRKFLADKAKIRSLVDIIMYMDLKLYSLKRQEQKFKDVVQLMKETFFRHAEKDALRSCVKAMNFCATESPGELQDIAQNIFKELETELTTRLESAIKVVVDGDGDVDHEYALLVNLKRLYVLQSERDVPLERLYGDFAMILGRWKTTELGDEVLGFLLLNMNLYVARLLQTNECNSEEAISFLLEKRYVLFDQLEQLLQSLTEIQEEGTSRNHLARRVCTVLTESWCLFENTSFVSTKLERLDSTAKKVWELCKKQLSISDEKEGTAVKRRGRPRKYHKIGGTKQEDSISRSDRDAPEDEAHLIHSLENFSSVRVSRKENKGQIDIGTCSKATENLEASQTSGEGL